MKKDNTIKHMELLDVQKHEFQFTNVMMYDREEKDEFVCLNFQGCVKNCVLGWFSENNNQF